MRVIDIYISYFKSFILKMTEYRVDFIIGTLSILIQQVILLSSISIIFDNVIDMDGYTKNEFFFMYGMSTISSSICYTFFDGLWTIGGQYIKKGLLDRILLRPINPLFQIIAERIKIEGIPSILLGGAILVTSSQDYIDYSNIFDVLILAVLIISSVFIFSGILLIIATLAFWIVDSLSFMQLINNFSEYGRYPVSIYPKFLAIVLSSLIPFLFTSFYPVSYFLTNNNYLKLSILTPMVSVSLWWIGINFWKLGLKKYGATGT